MCSSLYFATFLLLIGGCFGMFGFNRNHSEFDIDEYDYKGDPFGISCVYDESSTEFHQENITENSEISEDLAERLNNGKPLSLYIDGIYSHIKANSSTFKFAKEWFKASGSNVCYFTYAPEKIYVGTFNLLLAAEEMVQSHRLQFAAKVARDFVLKIRDQCIKTETPGCLKHMSQVTVLGFSFGAHIASQTCLNLFQRTGEKVGKLIGLDPAGIIILLKLFHQSYIKKGDAEYVQIVHTDPLLHGTSLTNGDVDIMVDNVPAGIKHKHAFVPYLHMATSMKKLLLIAEKNGKGQIIPIDENSAQANRVLKQDEVIVGVYSEVEDSKRGQIFRISLANRGEILRDSIAHVVKVRLE